MKTFAVFVSLLFATSALAQDPDWTTTAKAAVTHECQTAASCNEIADRLRELGKQGGEIMHACFQQRKAAKQDTARCEGLYQQALAVLERAKTLRSKAAALLEVEASRVAAQSQQRTLSADLCEQQADLAESQREMASQREIENASGVVDLPERRAIGAAIVRAQKRIRAIRQELATRKLTALACAEIAAR